MTEENKEEVAAEEAPKVPTDESGVPKNFMIRCLQCGWKRTTSGISSDLTDIREILNGCPTCGGPRNFRCKKCGGNAQMVRIRGNT